MKSANSKTTRPTNNKDSETDKKALAVIQDLELKNGQIVSEEELLIVIKAYYGKDYPQVMSDLINSHYIKTVYVVDLKAKPE